MALATKDEALTHLVELGFEPHVCQELEVASCCGEDRPRIAQELLSRHHPARMLKNILQQFSFERVNILTSDQKIIVSGDALFEDVRICSAGFVIVWLVLLLDLYVLEH